MQDRRDEFLIEVYRQMLNDINRHILVVWQSVGVLVSAFAFLSLVEKNVVSRDIATGLIVMLCGCVYGHLADAAYWYNRNLVIIANIERQLLKQSDLADIHYYFGAHRKTNEPITHLRMQQHLAIGLGGLVVLWHLLERVLPGAWSPWRMFDPMRAIPYCMAVGACFYGAYWVRRGERKYQEFLKHSPGMKVDTSGISYGIGHGHGGGK